MTLYNIDVVILNTLSNKQLKAIECMQAPYGWPGAAINEALHCGSYSRYGQGREVNIDITRLDTPILSGLPFTIVKDTLIFDAENNQMTCDYMIGNDRATYSWFISEINAAKLERLIIGYLNNLDWHTPWVEKWGEKTTPKPKPQKGNNSDQVQH